MHHTISWNYSAETILNRLAWTAVTGAYQILTSSIAHSDVTSLCHESWNNPVERTALIGQPIALIFRIIGSSAQF